MTGAVSLLLAFLAAFLEFDSTANRAGLALAGVFCLLLSVFRIWRSERIKVKELETKNLAQRPMLRGYILQTVTGSYSEKIRTKDGGIIEKHGFLLITPTLRILNEGNSPTTIKAVSCQVDTPTGCGAAMIFDEPEIYNEWENNLLKLIKDQRALKPGMDVEGELSFRLPLRTEQFDPVTSKVKFSIRDAWEQEHAVQQLATLNWVGRKRKGNDDD